MAKSTRQTGAAKTKLGICPQCGEEITAGLEHCEGSKVAYGCKTNQPHHGRVLWELCWKCSSGMGCSSCVPGKLGEHAELFNDELICKRCRVKANLESLLNGGPISRFTFNIGNKQIFWGQIHKHTPDLAEYPFEWRAKYAAQRLRFDLPLDVGDEEAIGEVRKSITDLIAGVGMPRELSKRERQKERNRQVAILSRGVQQPTSPEKPATGQLAALKSNPGRGHEQTSFGATRMTANSTKGGHGILGIV